MSCPVLLKDDMQSEMRTAHVRATISPYEATSMRQLSYALLHFHLDYRKNGQIHLALSLLELKERFSGTVVLHAKFSKTYLSNGYIITCLFI